MKLKQALLDRYTLSNDQRIKEVLDNIHFSPPELPSVFFRRLLATANGVLPYDIVLQRFRERLPSNIANAIAPMTNKLGTLFKATGDRQTNEEKTMLEVADAIQPQTSVSTISSASCQHSNNIRARPRSASRSRASSTKRFNENGAWCKNHFRYREKTRTCSRPGQCSFKVRKNNQKN